MADLPRPIAIYHEHPDWFRPLFAELDRRGTSYVRLDAAAHTFDVSSRDDADAYAVVLNRMSPSAYLRGHGQGIFHTLGYLAHLERLGVRVINGTRAYGLEISKAQQLALLRTLGLPFPAARVINHASQAVAASQGLRFPVVVKANVGGSGAGIVRYDTPDALARAAGDGRLDLGIDQTALVQEYIPARGGHITRVEVLDGRFLYAINVYAAGDSFNLCPADICQTSAGVALARGACAIDAPRNGIRVEQAHVGPDVVADVERIMREAGIEIGGVEFLVDDRDGQRYYYDINALSNFVADAPRVVGFDPFATLAEWLEREAAAALAARHREELTTA
jgi:hypothetical protein